MSVARSLAAVLVVAFLGTGGCGDNEERDPRASTGMEPAAWARSVCGALTPWRTRIADLTARAQQQMSGATTPQQTKANLVGLLAGAEEASELARTEVASAGAPAVADGTTIALRFTASLERARDAYGHAKTTVHQLPVGAAKSFYDGVSAAFATLAEEYAASALDTGNVGSAELQRAFDEVPECR